MSFIISYKTENFVAMAADKRLTYIHEDRFEDNCAKIKKLTNLIYGLAGSSELGHLFNKNLSASNINDFLIYADDFFRTLDATKNQSTVKENWIKQKFDLTLQVAGVNNKVVLIMYQIKWNEDGYLKGVIPDNSTTKDYPMFVAPEIGNELINIENYIVKHHPHTIKEAENVTEYLMKYISNISKEVSADFDFESILLH